MPASTTSTPHSGPHTTPPITPPTGASPFSHLAGANLAAQAAEQISLAAVPMVAVLTLGAGARETGWLAAAQSLPFLLLALPFGLWADRASRRRLMVGAEALRVLAMALLAVLVWQISGAGAGAGAAAGSGAAASPSTWALPVLALLGFASAVGTVAFSVAAPAMVALLVPLAELGRANGRIELARSLAFASGPALAGVLVAAAGGGSAFALAALLSTMAVALLLRLPADDVPRTGAAPRHPLIDLRAGAAFVWHNRLLRPVLLTAVVWNISWMVLQAAYVPHATQHLGLGARGIGLTLALYGVGMVLGSLVASRLMVRMPFGWTVALGPMVSVLAAATLLATLAWPTPWLAALSFFLFGAGPIVWTVSSTTLRQTLTPDAMLGRVSSIFITANAGARPVGAALAALVATQVGADAAVAACLTLATLGFALQAAFVVASPLRALATLPPTAR